MPKALRKSSISKKIKRSKGLSNTEEEISARSYKGFFYGGMTFVIIIALLLGIFKIMFNNTRKNIADVGLKVSKEESSNAKTEKQAINGGKEYIVVKGDTLWSISEKEYKSGYGWVELAKANKLENPDVLVEGTKLILPKIGVPKEVVAKQSPGNEKIEANSYTVVKGDNLWNIAVRSYGDGYKWVELAKVNKLVNPDLIHPGNVFKIPR